jgi:hypothetical protein
MKKKYMNKIHITNNIVESIHGKINYYLPKHITNVFNFLNCINKIFLNDTIDNNTNIRHDYITKSLLLLIDKENLNNEFKWIDFTKFKYYLNLIIKEQKEIINGNNLDKLIHTIDMEVAEDDDISNNNCNSE